MKLTVWTYFVACSVIVPIVMMVLGLFLWKLTPKRESQIYAYRTKMSLINDDTWYTANKMAGKAWFFAGVITLVVTLLIDVFLKQLSDEVLGNVGLFVIIAQVIVLAATIVPVEGKLKDMFDVLGNRKTK